MIALGPLSTNVTSSVLLVACNRLFAVRDTKKWKLSEEKVMEGGENVSWLAVGVTVTDKSGELNPTLGVASSKMADVPTMTLVGKSFNTMTSAGRGGVEGGREWKKEKGREEKEEEKGRI